MHIAGDTEGWRLSLNATALARHFDGILNFDTVRRRDHKRTPSAEAAVLQKGELSIKFCA
jgi:hypothetical protein